MYEFVILGEPVAQKRPRFSRRGGFVTTYDPSIRDKKNLIKQLINRPKEHISGAVIVHCMFFFTRPKSHFNSKGEVKNNAPIFKTTKPDIDNLVKFVLDALNQIVWKDDATIFSIKASKYYAKEPKTIIRIFTNDKQ